MRIRARRTTKKPHNQEKEKAQKAVKETVGNNGSTTSSTTSAVTGAVNKAIPAGKGKTFYVSATTGSARADGLTPATAMKDLQKAIDAAEENDVIYVAEGNYLGNMDRGYIECGKFGNAQNDRGKFISFYGGYAPDFSERDVVK